jgi:hypothetical protein
MLDQVSGDLKHLCRGPWGPENQANFPMHLILAWNALQTVIFMYTIFSNYPEIWPGDR